MRERAGVAPASLADVPGAGTSADRSYNRSTEQTLTAHCARGPDSGHCALLVHVKVKL